MKAASRPLLDPLQNVGLTLLRQVNVGSLNVVLNVWALTFAAEITAYDAARHTSEKTRDNFLPPDWRFCNLVCMVSGMKSALVAKRPLKKRRRVRCRTKRNEVQRPCYCRWKRLHMWRAHLNIATAARMLRRTKRAHPGYGLVPIATRPLASGQISESFTLASQRRSECAYCVTLVRRGCANTRH